MQIMSEYDLIRAMSGVDKYGEGKCMVAVKQQRYDSNGNCVDVDDEFITEKPVVNVFRQPGGYVLVDLYFHSVEDKDLKIVYSYLDRFLRPENSSSDDGLDFPLLSFAFLPKEFEGQYWALGVNPIFGALTPENSTGEPRIIRLAFRSQPDTSLVPNFVFLTTPEGEMEELEED